MLTIALWTIAALLLVVAIQLVGILRTAATSAAELKKLRLDFYEFGTGTHSRASREHEVTEEILRGLAQYAFESRNALRAIVAHEKRPRQAHD